MRDFVAAEGLAGKSKELAFFRSQSALQEKAHLLEKLFVRHLRYSRFGGGMLVACWVVGWSANEICGILPHFVHHGAKLFLTGFHSGNGPQPGSKAGNRISLVPENLLIPSRPRNCASPGLRTVDSSVCYGGGNGRFRTVRSRIRIQSSNGRPAPETGNLHVILRDKSHTGVPVLRLKILKMHSRPSLRPSPIERSRAQRVVVEGNAHGT